MGIFGKRDMNLVIQNPLKIKAGQYVNLNALDYSGQFQVTAMEEWTRSIRGNTHKFVDYCLSQLNPGGEPVQMRIRMNPTAVKQVVGMSQKILALKLDADMEYNEGLHDLLKEDTGKFEEYDDDKLTAEWWRINDVSGQYDADILSVNDKNGDGKVTADETSRRKIVYWDFWREIVTEGGNKQVQYCFVEMDAKTGWMQIWKGAEIDESEIS